MKIIKNCILSPMLIIIGIATANAELFYTPREYYYLYSEKVALEIAIKTQRTIFLNEKENLENSIKELQLKIDGLVRDIEALDKRKKDDDAAFEKKLEDCNKLVEILKGNKNELEKKLIHENTALQQRYNETISRLTNEYTEKTKELLDEIKAIKIENEKTVATLKSQISNLSEELSEIKELNEQQRADLSRMEKQAGDLEKQLKEEISKGDIRLKKFHDRIIINLDDRICFDSGYAYLKRDVLHSLEKISAILQQYPEYNIMIEGHTDTVPIHNEMFRNNWQLSTERALAVLDYILKRVDLSPQRFSAIGYGEYRPIVSNETSENRALNRRVDIVVMPIFREKLKPDR